MKYTLKSFAFVVVAMMLSSCASLDKTTTVKGVALMPDLTRLELRLSDIEYIGEVEISYQSRQYLRIFRHLDSINNQRVDQRNIERVNLLGKSGIKMNKNLERAAVKAVEEYPNADFFVPVYRVTNIEKMFMGRIYREKMLLKAYRFNQ